MDWSTMREIRLSLAIAAAVVAMAAESPATAQSHTVTIVTEHIQRVSPGRQGPANRMRSVQPRRTPGYFPGTTKYPTVKLNRAAPGGTN
jgi:hypothetical protein